MPRFAIILFFPLTLFAVFCNNNPQNARKVTVGPDGVQTVSAVYGTPVLDGSAADEAWDASDWLKMDQLWSGQAPEPADFSGRYKLAWDQNNLYILAEITDDSLLDIYPQGVAHFWDDDCLAIFIDDHAPEHGHEAGTGGFSYNIGLDGRVADMDTDSTYRAFDDHCLTRMITRGHSSTWEIAVRIFDRKTFTADGENLPKLLTADKKIGFALAYNDNDRSPERETLMGSIALPDQLKDRKWVNAAVFGMLTLK